MLRLEGAVLRLDNAMLGLGGAVDNIVFVLFVVIVVVKDGGDFGSGSRD